MGLLTQTMPQNLQQQPAGNGMTFPQAWQLIVQTGKGTPALLGNAAIALAGLMNQQLQPGAGYAGSGLLTNVQFSEPAQVIQLANELQVNMTPAQQSAPDMRAQLAAEENAQRAQHAQIANQPNGNPSMFAQTVPVQHNTVPVAIVPPDAPASNPALAAQPMPGFAMPGQQTMQMMPAQPGQMFASSMQPQTNMATVSPGQGGVNMSGASVVQQTQGQAVTPSQTPTGDQPKRRGRKPGSTNKPKEAPTELIVLVDCDTNTDADSLDDYIEGIHAALVAKFMANTGLTDIRCAPKDSPAAYGGWRGAIRQCVIDNPPPDGTYLINVHGDEIRDAVAHALLSVCNSKGGTYVRGIR